MHKKNANRQIQKARNTMDDFFGNSLWDKVGTLNIFINGETVEDFYQ